MGTPSQLKLVAAILKELHRQGFKTLTFDQINRGVIPAANQVVAAFDIPAEADARAALEIQRVENTK